MAVSSGLQWVFSQSLQTTFNILNLSDKKTVTSTVVKLVILGLLQKKKPRKVK